MTTSARTMPYRKAEMIQLLEPRSVALVGASPNPSALGGRTLKNLAGFSGRLYPVNPAYRELAGRTCYPSIASLPEEPDCVVLAVPRDAVEPIVHECGERGAGAVIVLASGYAETTVADDATAQQQLTALASRYRMRIVGPNCVGVACRPSALHAAFAEFSPSTLVPGNRVGIISQSGAVGLGLSHAAEHGASISHVLTCGNSCDVDVADYVAYLAEDEHCDAIALVFEGLANKDRFEEAARLVARNGKRIAACKLAVSAPGIAAARFHTGTAPGSAEQWSDLFSRLGIIGVARIEALMETAAFLARTKQQRVAPGVAIVSGSGGTGILASDASVRHGVAMPQPAPATVERLRAAIPSFGSPRNPCDATAQVSRNPDSLRECADALLSDPQYGALVIPWGRAQPVGLMDQLGEVARHHNKPVCLVWMSQKLEDPLAEAAARNPSIALFRSLDACFDALGQLQRGG